MLILVILMGCRRKHYSLLSARLASIRLPSMMSSLVPESSLAWSSRAALAGSHDGHTSAASFTDSQSRLISERPVLPGLTEVGADTVIIEADDPVNGLSLDLAIQLTDNGLVRCRAGVTNKNAADYRLEALETLPAGQRPGHASRRVRRTCALDSGVAVGLLVC